MMIAYLSSILSSKPGRVYMANLMSKLEDGYLLGLPKSASPSRFNSTPKEMAWTAGVVTMQVTCPVLYLLLGSRCR